MHRYLALVAKYREPIEQQQPPTHNPGDGYAIRAILLRPEGRGLPHTRSTSVMLQPTAWMRPQARLNACNGRRE